MQSSGFEFWCCYCYHCLYAINNQQCDFIKVLRTFRSIKLLHYSYISYVFNGMRMNKHEQNNQNWIWKEWILIRNYFDNFAICTEFRPLNPQEFEHDFNLEEVIQNLAIWRNFTSIQFKYTTMNLEFSHGKNSQPFDLISMKFMENSISIWFRYCAEQSSSIQLCYCGKTQLNLTLFWNVLHWNKIKAYIDCEENNGRDNSNGNSNYNDNSHNNEA